MDTHEITETFSHISVDVQTSNIIFALSDDGRCRVECYEDQNAKHSVTVQNNTLVIKSSSKPWYKYIGFNFVTPKLTIYLPENVYGSLFIDNSTGTIDISQNLTFESAELSTSTGKITFANAVVSDLIQIKAITGHIYLENLSAGSIDTSCSTGKTTMTNVDCTKNITLSTSTGSTHLTDITCRNLATTGNTGKISLKNVIASENFSIQRNTGNVEFEGCDAAQIFIKTNTGDITGTLLSGKIFAFPESTLGKVDVPKTYTGGLCEIISNTGNIKISLEK